MSRREEFQKSENGSPFAKLHNSTAYKAAVDLALLLMLEDQQPGSDPIMAAANHHRMEGARTLLKKLASFTELPKVEEKPAHKLGHLKYS